MGESYKEKLVFVVVNRDDEDLWACVLELFKSTLASFDGAKSKVNIGESVFLCDRKWCTLSFVLYFPFLSLTEFFPPEALL